MAVHQLGGSEDCSNTPPADQDLRMRSQDKCSHHEGP